jgi:uncharacterized protein (TIGR03437 family)
LISVPADHSQSYQLPVIDSAGRTIVYLSVAQVLLVYQIATQRETVLAKGGYYRDPYLSADGNRVMFLSAPSVPTSFLDSPQMQIWTVNTDGSGLHQVTNEATGVFSAAMSDNGHAAWYLSGTMRLFQLDLDSGRAVEKLGRAPYLPATTGPVVPGAKFELQGVGFSDESFAAQFFPLPGELGGITVTMEGVRAALLSVTPTNIVAQAPWEIVPRGRAQIQVTIPTSSPFESQTTVSSLFLLSFGTFVPSSVGDTLVVHEAWDAPVTPTNPARSGEIVHLFGTGFGPVDAAPPTGMPAPSNPPAHTIVPVTCIAREAYQQVGTDVPVLFSGLAPGLVGYYQLDVRLPALNVTTPIARFRCSGGGGLLGSDDLFSASFPFTGVGP